MARGGESARGWTIGLAGLLVLGGCASDAEEAPPEVREGPRSLSQIAMTTGFVMDDTASVLASITLRENATAACMHEAGFDYTPKVPDAAAVELSDEDAPAEGSPEYVAAYGYGIWSTPAGVPRNGVQWTMPDLEEEIAYLASMSETEMAAYQVALYGEPDPADPTFVTGGCIDVADRPGSDDAEQAYLAGFREEMTAFLLALPDAPELAEVNADWSACLREAGYSFAHPGAARQSVSGEFEAALAATGGMLPESAAAEHAPQEIALATADLTCREETDFDARSAEITWQLEEDWIESHRAEVDAYLDAVAAWQPAE